jgi:DNA-binding NarL/FixJ family response regulator
MLPRILLIGHGAYRTSLLILIRMNFSKAEILKSGSLHEGIFRIQLDLPDFVLVDIDHSGPRTLETLKAVSASHPAIRFAVMSTTDRRECISASLEGRMHGFVSKRQSDEDILTAIKEILSGGVYVPWCSAKGRGGAGVLNLTPRQQQVLRLLSLGMSNKEIARALRIAESTTKIHTAMLMRALGVRNRTEAAFKAGKLLSATEQALSVSSSL